MAEILEKLIGYAGDKPMFRGRDAEETLGISRVQLRRYVRAGLLESVSRGVYALAGHEFPETQTLLEVAVAAPKAVICLLSALQFHELTTQVPAEVWIAVDRATRPPRITSTRTRVFRLTSGIFEAGIETHLVDGVELKVYSAAKTVADCFRYEKTVGLDVAVEALRDALRLRKATIAEILEFAGIRGVKTKMMPYITAFTI